MSYSITHGIVKLKNEFVKQSPTQSFVREVIPLSYSKLIPVTEQTLLRITDFVNCNPIYIESNDLSLFDISCRAYLGDINDYLLSTKKYDANYQPFYPTWMLSAYALALEAKLLGFKDIVDIGSGDGRIAYCGKLLGLRSIGIEIDSKLTILQQEISGLTDVEFEIVHGDATKFAYDSLDLSRPMFFISGLPEWGDMLATSVIPSIMEISKLRESSGFNFMGSHTINKYSRDKTRWGWGKIIELYHLKIKKCITLPTYWTNDQKIDTAYVFTTT
ncbi:MAG: hypothetical protein WAM14_21165 [Candidatus Nitrosopolaris sp.]